MNGFLFSIAWILIVMAVTTAVFHRWNVRRRFRVMSALFAAGLVGFLASALLMSGKPSTVETLNGLYFYVFWFFGVAAQCYGLADRGFSLAVLSDLDRLGGGPRTREEIRTAYANGRGLDYVKEKRIGQILHGGFMREQEGRYIPTSLGRWVGLIGAVAQRFYGFQDIG